MVLTEIGQFQRIVGDLIELVDELAKEAETEKMKVGLAARAHALRKWPPCDRLIVIGCSPRPSALGTC